MVIVYVVLALILFGLNLFLTLRQNSSRPGWPVNFIFALIGVVMLLDLFWIKSDESVFAMFFLAAYKLSNFISTPILEKRAGSLVLAYNRSGCISIVPIIVTMIVVPTFIMAIFTDWPSVRDTRFIHDLMLKIMAFTLAIAYIPGVFRKGKIFENGFTTPELQHYPWSAYKRYRWVEHVLPENKKSYYIALENRNDPAVEIHGLSEQDKNALEELLSTKLERIHSTHS